MNPSEITPVWTGWLPEDQYNQVPAVRASHLKEMAVSPLQYRWRLHNPLEATDAMKLGSAIHTAVLEPVRFNHLYVAYPGKVRRGKEWEAFEKEHADRTILTATQMAQCEEMQKALRAHPVAGPVLCDIAGLAEHAAVWTDPDSGVDCKAKIDLQVPPDQLLYEFKSTGDINPDQFGRVAWRFKYHFSLAYYQDAVKAVMGYTPDVRYIIAQSSPPYDVVVATPNAELIAQGREEYKRHLKTLAKCRETGEWPGVASLWPGEDGKETRETLDPAWALGDNEALKQFEEAI